MLPSLFSPPVFRCSVRRLVQRAGPARGTDPEALLYARNWLQSSHDVIPRQSFQISFSRASGPGGQKVNKTSSKATVALSASDWLRGSCVEWMPQAVIDHLKTVPFRYQTKAGGLLIQSDTSRNQNDNVDECFRKLWMEIRSCVHFPAEVQDSDKAKWRRLAAKATARRLEDKRRLSDKKRGRRKGFDL